VLPARTDPRFFAIAITLLIVDLQVVFLLSIPVAITRPGPAKLLWVLTFVSGLVLRRLESADQESATTDELGG
jgi:NADH:ubiquinone oxidoreductase subunit 3 (subunit A)